MEDPTTNPFYIAQSDNPDLVLVSEPLTPNNFASWSRAMKIALIARNKLGLVVSWLLNSISKDLTTSVVYSSSAAQIWKELHDRFEDNNGSRMVHLRRQLLSCSQGSLSVNAYFNKLKGLWEELSNFQLIHSCVCGNAKNLVDYLNEEYVMTFLVGLNDSFHHICGQILLMEPLPSISQVYSLVIQEEQQRQIAQLDSRLESHFACAVKVSDDVKSKTAQKNHQLL